MPYESIDAMQLALANDVFAYAKDSKKASGRALGMFVEILTFYLLKAWDLEEYTAIERRLPEYANPQITHNVEFSLHPPIASHDLALASSDLPITTTKILRELPEGVCRSSDTKTNQLLSSKGVLRNACTIWETERSFAVACLVSERGGEFQIKVTELHVHPFAVFECKRVGVEEGAKKGPQTIEKAKQGAYVARTVSSLQKISMPDGTLGGFIHLADGTVEVKQYVDMLAEVIASANRHLLRQFTLTVGVVSNHGNWFTSDDHNKELKVLAQSYDWLLFLTDPGLAEFVTDVLLGKKNKDVPEAFLASYGPNKSENKFTKVKLDRNADALLQRYFSDNLADIESWFNADFSSGALSQGTEGRTLDSHVKELEGHSRMTAGRTVNSQSVRWCTPPKYVQAITRVLGDPIALDPCSDEVSIGPAETVYMLPDADGLKESWSFPTIYVNPPYGADRRRGTTIKHWLRRCMRAHLDYDSEVLALVPVAVNTRHWKECVWGRATAVCFLYDTRLRFLEDGRDQGKGAPMACAMIYWGRAVDRFIDVFAEFGAPVDIRGLHGKRLGQREDFQTTLFSDA